MLVGAVGDDDAGRAYAVRLASLGIQARLTTAPDTSTGIGWITVDDFGENAIVVIPGANAHAVAQVDDLQPGDVLLCQLELPVAQVERAVRRAAAVGARVVLNAAPFTVLARDVVAVADPMVVNEHEAAALADSGLVPRSLLVTFGAAGCTVGRRPSRGRAPARARGRRHHGGGRRLLRDSGASLASGADRHTALVAATQAAAEAVRRIGAQPDPRL